MPKKIPDKPEVNHDVSAWAMLLEETKAEITASNDLSDEEKRLLGELDALREEDWTLGVCSGKPISETIIDDRGER